ncbi:MAG: nucleotide exchange factor GrpE [SAR86 cluster bacterium]|uniref:Protein GrpE n=1 Tax=SAR86 cluster bacterium TaxID=2030880 RepID=A0A937I1S7_9GAMM|nr:nucleotide exchange factor GrpE [SAR86 cluster bacterium]
MAKSKKKNTNTNPADKNSNEESFVNEESFSKENSSEKEVESKISSEVITALEEKVLRAHAEVDNVRRTSQREILKARVFSAELITKDLLSPIDNLTRALQHSEEEIPRSLIELVLKEISQALSNNNIEEIDPIGDTFDPNFHEALSVKEDKSKPTEEILEVVQKGYKIQERVIRPALVIVNKI